MSQEVTKRRRWWTAFIAALMAVVLVGTPTTPARVRADEGAARSYTNPLQIQVPGGGMVQSCADPSIIHAQPPDTAWYLYCTTDPLNDTDRASNGDFNFHLMAINKSYDLVHWTYIGDAFASRPSWVRSDAGLWAPDIEYLNHQYYLYYTASDTNLPGGGSAIGVATSPSAAGPWTDQGVAVEPHAASCCPGSRRWVFDPEVVDTGAAKYIFYGSYFGGISARLLSPDGLHSDPASQVQITIANRYEGVDIVRHGGYWYLMGSASNCCNGALTGYSVFAGRSTNLLGPYVDREGVSLLAGRVGGTPVVTMNGNRWVGPGHNSFFTDMAGHDWLVYHAVDRFAPYFAGTTDFTKRPALMDALTWVGGWPMVRGGRGPSDTPQAAPVTGPADQGAGDQQGNNDEQAGDQQGTNDEQAGAAAGHDRPGRPIPALSDEFNGSALSPQWSWVRQPGAASYGVGGGAFRFDTQNADLYVDSNNASVLTEPTPAGDYVVETKVSLNVPAEGCCQNFVQAGLVIYGDDDNFIKLAHVSIFETRQTEFAKEQKPVPAGAPRYGNTVVGPPGEWTYLRIVKRVHGAEELYTAYTSQDGVAWVHGGTWTHTLGSGARIGLVSMGGSGFTANFDYVRVSHLRH